MNTSNKKKSNIKTLLLALTLVFAIAFSAFKNQTPERIAPKAIKAGMITGDYIVQPQLNEFRDYVLMTPPSDGDCTDPASKDCIYHVTTLGKSQIPAEPVGGYTAGNIEDYLADEWIEPVSEAQPALFGGAYQ